MTAFGYDNLPDELPSAALPPELFGDAQAALNEALNSGLALAQEIKVAYVYERHGNMSFDAIAGKRNASYCSDNDDMVIQMTVRVPSPKVWEKDLHKITVLEELVTEHALKAERKRLVAEIAADEASAAKILEAARLKRERLIAMMVPEK